MREPVTNAGTITSRVRIDHVSKTFDVRTERGHEQVAALDDVSLDIADGEVIALTGLSGCGKTTLLRIIMGLETATSGTVQASGKEVTGCGYDRGLVFQQAQLLPWRSALQNVEFGLEVQGVPEQERHERAREMLALVGLADSADRRPDQLSGGMQQRVGLARALSIDPAVLLMDEPFAALDAQTREGLQLEVLRIQAETHKTVVFVTHDLDEAILIADRVVLMYPKPGRIGRIFDVDLPKPRTDFATIRGLPAFAELRYELWRSLMDSGDRH
jgi:NitT/TauT family transport system ATP-binding protein